MQSDWEAIRTWLLSSGLRIAFILAASLIGYRLLRALIACLERLMAGKAPTEQQPW